MTYHVQSLIYSCFVPIQVFTGAVPFSNTPSVTAVLAVTQGERPPRPTHPTFTANLWTLMQRCWDKEPHLRPEASEVLQILLTLSVFSFAPAIVHSLIWLLSRAQRTSCLEAVDRPCPRYR